MRVIQLYEVKKTVARLIRECSFQADSCLIKYIQKVRDEETSPLGKNVLEQILKNQTIAVSENIPLCQDTGQVVVFLEIGGEAVWSGNMENAVNAGVRQAYEQEYLRKSVVGDPLLRKNTGDNTPAIIHTKTVVGDKIKISVNLKGGGAENMSALKMLTPAAGREGVINFVLETVENAGGKACPPLIIGIGIGGNLEKAPLLAKEALLRDLSDHAPQDHIRELEEELLIKINKTGIGPMGYGGAITALAVKINTYPCHIASLPVAVNLQCHVVRHQSEVI